MALSIWAHLNGHVFMSDCTDGSSILRPISRFASNTVFLGLMATCTHYHSLILCRDSHTGHCPRARHTSSSTPTCCLASVRQLPRTGALGYGYDLGTVQHMRRNRTWFFAASPMSRSLSVKAT